MKKLKSSLPNMVLVLVCVALITGGLLAWVNHVTEKPIAEQSEKKLLDGIKEVMGGEKLIITSNDIVKKTINGKELSFVVHNVVDGRNANLGAAVESKINGFGGDLKVLVGFSPSGTIIGYTIIEMSETPGLGAKADKWFQQGEKGSIIGKNVATKPLVVKKDGGDIDGITASTITSRAFLNAINQAYIAYK